MSAKPSRAIDRLVGNVLVVVMAVSVVNVLWQVFTRFALANASSFTEELARYLLMWMGMFGGAYAVGRGRHLAIDLLPRRLEGRSLAYWRAAVAVVILGFAAIVLVAGGMRLVVITLQLGQRSAALGIPLGYVYLVLPLSGALMIWYATSDLVAAVRTGAGRVPPSTRSAGAVR